MWLRVGLDARAEHLLFSGPDVPAVRAGQTRGVLRELAAWTGDRSREELGLLLRGDPEEMDVGLRAKWDRLRAGCTPHVLAISLEISVSSILRAEGGLDDRLASDLVEHWEA